MKTRGGIGLLFAAALLTHGCSSEQSEGYGSASVAALTSSDVDRVEVTIDGTSFAETLSRAAVSGNFEPVVINDIPIGSYTFRAEAYDDTTTPGTPILLYTGTADATITDGVQTSVTILLQQVPPADPFDNTVPIFQSLVYTPANPTTGQVVTLTVSVLDPDVGDGLTLLWSAPGGGTLTPPLDQPSVVWTAPSTDGTYPVTITASDLSGATSTLTADIDVATNLVCPDLVCTFSATASSITNYFVATSENLPFSGTINIDCAAQDGACSCTSEYAATIGPIPVAGIGDVCLVPSPSPCLAGTISCDGGTDQNVTQTQDHNIGICTDNVGCRAACSSFCAAQQKAPVENGPACEGSCRNDTAPRLCLPDNQVPSPGDNVCALGDTCDEFNNHGTTDSYCGCQCIDIGDDTVAGPGEALLYIGYAIHVIFDSNGDGVGDLGLGLDGEPCTEDDVDDPGLITGPQTCVPFTTSTASVTLPDAGYFDPALSPVIPIDGLISPADRVGNSFTCTEGVPTAAASAVLQGVQSFKDTARYDFASMITITCE